MNNFKIIMKFYNNYLIKIYYEKQNVNENLYFEIRIENNFKLKIIKRMNYFSLKLFDYLIYLIFYFIHILSYASKRYKKKEK